jgi:signal transduction histidine kinase
MSRSTSWTAGCSVSSRSSDVAALARLPEPVEVAAYYVVFEALINATSHADASVVRAAVAERDHRLHF